MRKAAERQLTGSPDFYGTGEAALQREARRLANLFNSAWRYHLDQDDVDVLVAADRHWGFMRTGSNPEDIGRRPTPREFSASSLCGRELILSYNFEAVAAKCEREGVPAYCATCDGWGILEAYPGQRAESDAWEPTPPPAGEGWQLWETVSEGSPISPVFPTRDGLIDWMCSWEYCWGSASPLSREAAEQLVSEGWAPDLRGEIR